MPTDHRQRRQFSDPTLADLRRILSSGTPQELWDSIEHERGPPDLLGDAELKDIMAGELRTAKILGNRSVWIPPKVAVRILQSLIDKARVCARRANDVAAKKAVIRANKLLKQVRASLPRRPRHRPRRHWRIQGDALDEFRMLRSSGLSRHDAAAEAARGRGVRPATVLYWDERAAARWRVIAEKLRRWRAKSHPEN
jgi:hypothetical protein